jgi:hypothetical protein
MRYFERGEAFASPHFMRIVKRMTWKQSLAILGFLKELPGKQPQPLLVSYKRITLKTAP